MAPCEETKAERYAPVLAPATRCGCRSAPMSQFRPDQSSRLPPVPTSLLERNSAKEMNTARAQDHARVTSSKFIPASSQLALGWFRMVIEQFTIRLMRLRLPGNDNSSSEHRGPSPSSSRAVAPAAPSALPPPNSRNVLPARGLDGCRRPKECMVFCSHRSTSAQLLRRLVSIQQALQILLHLFQ